MGLKEVSSVQEAKLQRLSPDCVMVKALLANGSIVYTFGNDMWDGLQRIENMLRRKQAE